MKYLKFIPIMALIIIACNTVEDEGDTPAVPMDNEGNVINTIDPGTIAALDSLDFLRQLSDSSAASWNTLAFTLAGSNMFTSCRLDDIMTLSANGTYTYQGGVLCGAEDNQSVRNGTWEISYKDKIIYFDRGSGEEYQAEVIKLKDGELRVLGSYMGMEVRGLYAKN